MPKVDCIKLLRQAGIISDAEAKRMLADMERLARLRAASRGISYENAMAEIAGELKMTNATAHKVERRNQLLALQSRQWSKEYAKRFKTWGKGAEALLFGDPADVKGAGLGIWQIWQGLWGRYASRFVAAIEQDGAYQAFKHGDGAREFYLESEQLGVEGGRPGFTGNRAALTIAKVFRDVRLELVARMNQAGAFIKDLPGYVLMQTHDRGAIVRLNAKDMSDSFRQWRAMVEPLLDAEKTFGGSDPAISLREIHKNLYTGNHESYLDTFDVDTFRAHGALANKVSSPRVLWFKDAQSAFQYNERFGTRDYNQAILFHLRQMTKNIALMERLGPNPVENFKRIVQELQVEAKDRNDSNAQVNALDLDGLMRRLDVVTGKIDIPHNPSIARWFGLARALRLVSTGGKMVLSSFGDKPMMQSHMTYLGMSQLDAFGKAITLKGGKASRELSVAYGVVPHSLTGHVASRWGFEARTGYEVQNWAQRFFDLNFMNWWNDVNRAVMADATVAHIAGHAAMPMEALPPEVGRALRHYDISEGDWNAMRRTAYDVTEGPLEGRKVITSDAFERIPDAQLDALVESRGLTANAVNRKRQRELLKQKYEGLLLDSVDTGVPTPGAREKYVTTFGGRAQAGTWFGELARSVMMYKSFPLTVAMKVLGREVYGGGDGVKARDWLFSRQGKMRVAQLIAMSTIAGYAGMVAKDTLAGKTPKPLMVNGQPNMDAWMAAMALGGGLGIYGDFLFSEYEARYRSVLGGLAGPVLGQLDPIGAAIAKGASHAAEGDAEKLGYDVWKIGEQNLPFAGLFYVKPLLDYFIFWNVKEMLSPGVLQRMEHSVHDRNHQEFYVSPAGSASIPVSRPDEKLNYFLESITE